MSIGQRPFAPTDAQRSIVAAAARIGIPEDTIAEMIENPRTGRHIDAKTLRKYFRAQLDKAVDRANLAVGARLYRLAIDGNVAACIFWMKTRAGWREVNRYEHTGKDGEAIPVTPLAGLTQEQIAQAMSEALGKV